MKIVCKIDGDGLTKGKEYTVLDIFVGGKCLQGGVIIADNDNEWHSLTESCYEVKKERRI